jgi:hypothetical protein
MNHKNKEKRIDKEIFLLRNLPKEYKLGKKETQLGILLDVNTSFYYIFRMQICIFNYDIFYFDNK